MHNKGKSLLEFLDSYVVLDIETTGLKAEDCEIIELAAIKVINNNIVGEFEELIKPYNTVDGQIISLTKITNGMLDDKRRFVEVGKDFKEFIGDHVVVAHNANFDINFLINHFKDNGLGKFSNDFVDTLRLARLGIKDTKNHKLETMLDYFNIEQIDSHRAMIDVINTNKLYLELKKINQSNPKLFRPRNRFNFHVRTDLTEISSETPIDEMDTSNFFYNKKVCFTCDLLNFVKEDVAQTIVNLGGEIQRGVTFKTDVLILGDIKSQIDRYGKESNNHLKALDYIERGKKIEIIKEPQLKNLVDSNGVINVDFEEKDVAFENEESVKVKTDLNKQSIDGVLGVRKTVVETSIDENNNVDDVDDVGKTLEKEKTPIIMPFDAEQAKTEAKIHKMYAKQLEQDLMANTKNKSKLNSLNFLLLGVISFIIIIFINEESIIFQVLAIIFLFSIVISFVLKIKDLIKSYKTYKIKRKIERYVDYNSKERM